MWQARKIVDAYIRRALVQAYSVCFAITTLALLRAQLTEGGHMNAWNWVNITLFGLLTAFYLYFCFVQKIAVFEGLGKALV